MNSTKKRIAGILSGRPPKVWSEDHLTPAAVLIPLFLKEDQLHVLLTVRTERVETHKGQISFPGGVRESGDDDLLVTALRETEEEVGISPAQIEILGQLDQLVSVTDFIITPYVGLIPYPHKLAPSEDEIAEILEVPLALFIDDANRHIKKLEYRGRPTTVYYFDYQGHTIWGVTARILVGFLELLAAEDGALLREYPIMPRSSKD